MTKVRATRIGKAMPIVKATEEAIVAAAALREGGLVAFPTEGLGPQVRRRRRDARISRREPLKG